MSKNELLEKLRTIDEVTLLDLLDINADELVDAFYDKIQERFSYIEAQLNQEEGS